MALLIILALPAHAIPIEYSYTATLQSLDSEGPPFGQANVSGSIVLDDASLGLKEFSIDFGSNMLKWVWSEPSLLLLSDTSPGWNYLHISSAADIEPDGYFLEIEMEVYLAEETSLVEIVKDFDKYFSNDTVPMLHSLDYGSHLIVIHKVSRVPEPTTAFLFTTGLIGLFGKKYIALKA